MFCLHDLHVFYGKIRYLWLKNIANSQIESSQQVTEGESEKTEKVVCRYLALFLCDFSLKHIYIYIYIYIYTCIYI